ncbi:hypothetical protein GCM10023340_45460 [Nocardioides marinquilinus]|uniref:Carboxyltransferase domain-containing protein n=1 Tax=Nocardioides marinquilinus TaxID=1210400 RepID=A0ABP9Q8V2_9ACTN
MRDGVRCWVAVGGGVAVAPVLGSRATDTLAWVGPPRVEAGAVLPLGEPSGPPAAVDVVRPARPGPLRLHPGPRAEWFGEPDDAVRRTCATRWVVADADRVGVRLRGEPLTRLGPYRDAELPSEGMVLGAVQVPPDGQPVVFLADHPPTGGYPVVGVVDAADLARCAQLRPGDPVALRPA